MNIYLNLKLVYKVLVESLKLNYIFSNHTLTPYRAN
jgi:hypothetical protein